MIEKDEAEAIAARARDGRAAAEMLDNKVVKNKLWFYITRYVRERDPAIFGAHLAYQVKLEKDGRLFAAGPVTDADGNHEFGLVVVRAESAADARAIADGDPMHSSGLRTYTLHQWSLNEGHIGIGIDLHDGKITFR